MSRIVIGIGSNIDAEANLRDAASRLREKWPEVRFSSVFRTAPLLETDQEAFLNAVATFESEETPEDVQAALQSIEQALKKNPPYRFGPRTIDLDMLLFGDRSIETETLRVPHPKMEERRFVLEPLLELIEKKETHPVLGIPFEELLERVRGQDSKHTNIAL